MSGMMMHGLGDCTPELNCGCMVKSPRDVLRERIARALWTKDGQLPRWDEVPPREGYRLHYYRDTADAVIAALGPVAVYGAQQDEDIVWGWEPDVATVRREWPGLPVVRSYVTPWERIEDEDTP